MASKRQQPGDDETLTTALVTGATRGIGRAIATRLATLGYSVFLLGRDTASLESVTQECAAQEVITGCLVGDLQDGSYIGDAIQQAQALFGEIDVLINNAGTYRHEPVYSADLDAWRSVLEVNFSAAVHLSRCVLPRMIERKRGAIINISSTSGRNTESGSAIYSATKYALNGFTGCLYEDVRDFGIKVSAIMPGFVDTALTAELGKNAEKMIRPDDIADAVEYVLSSASTCCPTEIVIRPQLRP